MLLTKRLTTLLETDTSHFSSAALFEKLDVLNSAIDTLVDVMQDSSRPEEGFAEHVDLKPWECLCEAELEGRDSACKIIGEVTSLLQRQADGVAYEAREAAMNGR